MADKARIAVLLSGRGSNMAALLYASRLPDCPYEIALVAGDKPAAPGFALAEAEGIAVARLDAKALGNAFWDRLDSQLTEAGVATVALAGFMRIIPAAFIDRWAGRILNIHPSLLPRHKGLATHSAALAAGESSTGASVHLVTAELDDGPLLGQVEVAIRPNDTAETLAQRVLIAEHQLYSRVLADFVTRERSPDWLLGEVRELANALPEVEEKPSHGSPAFFVKGGKVFAYFSANVHNERRIALLAKISGLDEQQMLIEQDEERYFRPAYFGDNWIGIRLDVADTDWDGIADRMTQSWEMAAPRRLAGAFGR